MIKPLLNAITNYYRTEVEQYPMLNEVLDALTAATIPPAISPDPKPVIRHLDGLNQDRPTSPTKPIMDEFLAVARNLPWSQTYGYLKVLDQDYLDNYGYIRLIGPDSIVPHPDLRVGIGLWGPNLNYPMHHHEAEELYHVLYGQPEFRTDTTDFTTHSIGDAIHHRPWMPHAQRFGDTPTVLLYAWTGQVSADAELLESA